MRREQGLGVSARADGLRRFEAVVDALLPQLNELVKALPMKRSEHATIPAKPGVYLFTEGSRCLYVGQTRNIRQRLAEHTRPSDDRNTATLAFQIARCEASAAGIDTTGIAKELESRDVFKPFFEAAKRRVADMDVRFIEIGDKILRTVFEVYASVVLGTDREYNEFETH